MMHTPEVSGSGQLGVCVKCGLMPIIDGDEVYDGCIGKLPGDVMNACCGHGDDRSAYIQYCDGSLISGARAIDEQNKINETL
ncbi:hypothetical protein BTW00_05420 [Psychrobacter sp. C 20.9]|uniref:hypothetical protein n=1 Tax=Psychrobacter sp. C 20.9 TaxID=1926477 RepID=UPI000946DC56|nr:hypothetical protein [Psychrobacter sp. C 20.9]OLF36528.1 hypothetical protein BTW00_05420 [Psychrobacter sp. C 20.9]